MSPATTMPPHALLPDHASVPARTGRRGVRTMGATLAFAAGACVLQSGLAPKAMAAWGPVQATSAVNVRSAPASGSQVIGVLDTGDSAPEVTAPTRGYVPITWHGQRGYVWAALVSGGSAQPAPAPVPAPASTPMWATSAVNVRAAASGHARIVGQLATGERVDATGATHGAWTQVNVAGTARWVASRFLTATSPTPAPVDPSPAPTSPVPTTPLPTTSGRAAAALAFARAHLGEPYVYGATGPGSWDCSGLTQGAWAAAGVSIPRVSFDQLAQLTHVDRADLQPGDIVGFYGGGHVGIYLGDGQVIHAPHTGDVVRIAPLASMPYYTAVRP